MGIETSDDAAVYKIDDETALIQTLDFFTPVVDDPYTFGQIAAANSLSDVYAMGGQPKLAMNIVCFPDCLEPEVLTEILKGGQAKVEEAGALLVGGHSVSDDEPKYGLSVTGFVHPDQVLANMGARVGDLLVLTKPIGSGIINTAIKGQLADQEAYDEAVEVMVTLNKYAKEALDRVGGASSITDVTGFGLLGHALEMAEGSDVTIKIDHKKVPILKKAIEYGQMGLVPEGTYNNKNHIGDRVKYLNELDPVMVDLLMDPQTSGGLLIAIEADKAEELLKELEATPNRSAIVGQVLENQGHPIHVE